MSFYVMFEHVENVGLRVSAQPTFLLFREMYF